MPQAGGDFVAAFLGTLITDSSTLVVARLANPESEFSLVAGGILEPGHNVIQSVIVVVVQDHAPAAFSLS